MLLWKEDIIGSHARFTKIQAMRYCMATCEMNEVKTVGRQFT